MTIRPHTLSSFALALSSVLSSGCDHDFGTRIGPSGGVVASEDGLFQVEVPAGALSDTIGVYVHRVDGGPSGALRSYEIEPVGTVLSPPAAVQFDWGSLGALDGRELEGDSTNGPVLVVARGDEWQQMADRTVDVDAQRVAASANYFGVIAVVEQRGPGLPAE